MCSCWGTGRVCHGCPECCQKLSCEEKLLGSSGEAFQLGRPLIPAFFFWRRQLSCSIRDGKILQQPAWLQTGEQGIGGLILIPPQWSHLPVFPNPPRCKNLWQLPAPSKWIKSSGSGGRWAWDGFPQPCGSWVFFQGVAAGLGGVIHMLEYPDVPCALPQDREVTTTLQLLPPHAETQTSTTNTEHR